MPITEKLKGWLVANAGVKEDATDDELRKAAGESFADGKLTADKFQELAKEPDDDEADEFVKRFDSIADGLSKVVELLKPKDDDEAKIKEKAEATRKADEGEAARKAAEAKAAKGEKPSDLSKMIAELAGDAGDSDEPIDVRVKEAAEQYDGTRKSMAYPAATKSGRPHPLAGQAVKDYGRYGRVMDEPSQRDRAVAGAYAKFICSTAQRQGSRTFGFQSLNQHDKELLLYSMENMEWGGCGVNCVDKDWADICGRRLTGLERKALIDDATSGGLEAAPIVFDDQVIQTPLLHGELFPLVNTIPLDRGRRVEGVATGTVSWTWGGVDDTAVTLFNTASYVSAFDTTIYRGEGAILIGLDFLSDSPIDFGAHVTAQYGERLLEELDNVIATGNGTTQPQGVINTVGATSVAGGAATSIGNYESLFFGIAKSERRANLAASTVFCSTEESYQRAKAIPVGAADARRLFGEGGMGTGGYGNYSIMGQPYKINESLTSNQIFYAILGRYRMYRRRGLTMRSSTEGSTLIRANDLLMVATARYGGQMERGACVALTTTAEA